MFLADRRAAAAMGRLSGIGSRKPPPFLSPSSSFSSSSYSKRSRAVRRLPSLPRPPLATPAPHPAVRSRRRKAPARLWMRMDRWGRCEVFMSDGAFVAERSGVLARDLRVVGPLLSRCPGILAREKAMVINLEFIRAIVTTDEVLLLEPLAQEVIPFIDKLRRHFPLKSVEVHAGATKVGNVDVKHAKTCSECELPFEFQVRDELEHLLDHNENMEQLHLSRKQIKNPQDESLLVSSDLICNFPSKTNLDIPNSIIDQPTGVYSVAPSDVGDLEMLLESYFMQLDGIRNRIMMVRGYIVDTEDYINIQLDNQRNELIQFHLILIIVSFGISINTLIAGSFAMNMPHNGDYKL